MSSCDLAVTALHLIYSKARRIRKIVLPLHEMLKIMLA